MHGMIRTGLAGVWLVASLTVGPVAWGGDTVPAPQPPSPRGAEPPAQPGAPEAVPPRRALEPPAFTGEPAVALPASPPSLLNPEVVPIDLNTALRLAGVQNPELLIARQRVVEAERLRQLAAAQILPTLNGGTNYDNHTGVLQQSNGNILSINRSAVYVGAGAYAVAAGTVSIPGVVLTGNPAVQIYGYLVSRQVVREREFTSLAARNQVFLATCRAYSELLRAEGRRAVSIQVRDEARTVARLTADNVQVGEASQSDADRAATELARRESELQFEEGRVLTASARLAEVLNVDPSIRLHPTDAMVVPIPIVPDPIPVPELIAIALVQRPELGERRAVIREALLALEGAKVLPFSPTILLGFSSGGFGGGSNLVRPVVGGFGGRTDFDAISYWTLQNMGVGNVALINVAKARLRTTQYQEIAMLDRIRAEVAEAYARTHARFAQIGTSEQAVRFGQSAYALDFDRIRNRIRRALPIELLNSLRLLARARTEYIDAIVDYNEAQFELYVALGQPPANALAHEVPTEGVSLPSSSVNSEAPRGAQPPPSSAAPPFAPGAAAAAPAAEPRAAAGPPVPPASLPVATSSVPARINLAPARR